MLIGSLQAFGPQNRRAHSPSTNKHEMVCLLCIWQDGSVERCVSSVEPGRRALSQPGGWVQLEADARCVIWRPSPGSVCTGGEVLAGGPGHAGPQIPRLSNEDNNSMCFVGFYEGKNEMRHRKQLSSVPAAE